MMATNNAMYKMLDGRMGVPIFLDECGVSGNVKTDEFGYQIYEEREKHRLNADCTERVSGTWSTIPIMSGFTMQIIWCIRQAENMLMRSANFFLKTTVYWAKFM